MLFVLICKDLYGEGAARRAGARPDHLAYLESLGDKVRAAGGLLSEDGKEPRGSLIIIEADSLDDARTVAAADPYAKAGVFADVEIHPWRQAVGTVSLGYCPESEVRDIIESCCCARFPARISDGDWR